jgi:hypothetical protein
VESYELRWNVHKLVDVFDSKPVSCNQLLIISIEMDYFVISKS